jgi:hypothetical protein
MDVNGGLHVRVALPPEKEPPVAVGNETGRALKPVWTLINKRILSPAGNRTLATQPVK